MKCRNSVSVDSLHEGQVDIGSIFGQVATLKMLAELQFPHVPVLAYYPTDEANLFQKKYLQQILYLFDSSPSQLCVSSLLLVQVSPATIIFSTQNSISELFKTQVIL